MDKWKGKVAFVTGASMGIGAHITKALADAGMTVIGCSRRIEQIQVCALWISLSLQIILFFFYFKIIH